MKKTALLLAVTAFTAFSAFAQNRSIKFETGSFAEVLEKARKENKPIMMDAYTTWCGPCKMMDKKVFTNDTVADFYNANFIPFKSDMEKGEGPELAKRYEVKAYPNFLFISPDGSVLHRSVGAKPAQAFINEGKDALSPEKRYAFYQKKYDAGDRSAAFLMQFVAVKEMAALDNRPEIEAYFATQKPTELSSRQNWKMMNRFMFTSNIPAFKNLVDQRTVFSKFYTQDSVDQLVLRVYEDDLGMALYKNDSEELGRLKTELTRLNIKNSERIVLRVDAEVFKKKGDFNNYAKTITKLVDAFYANDPIALNSFAWTFYEKVDNKKMLYKAANWSEKAVALNPGYAFIDTQAAVLYKLGKKKEAQAAAENAIAAGKKSGEDVAETEALLKKINALK